MAALKEIVSWQIFSIVFSPLVFPLEPLHQSSKQPTLLRPGCHGGTDTAKEDLVVKMLHQQFSLEATLQ